MYDEHPIADRAIMFFAAAFSTLAIIVAARDIWLALQFGGLQP